MHTMVKLLLSVVMMLVIQFSVVSSAYSYSTEEMATIDVYEKITPSVKRDGSYNRQIRNNTDKFPCYRGYEGYKHYSL